METGKVKFFDLSRNFGFIKSDKTGKKDYYFTLDDCVNTVLVGDRVTFEVGQGPRGPRAGSVTSI